jgi:pyruvate formate lyase activating enzyme
MSKSREMDTLMASAMPEALAEAAERLECRSIAYTYNDPVIFMEYAMDTAQASRERGIRSVAVTAGYMCEEPRREFYRHMDAANIDLKAFTEAFYQKLCAGHLQDVLDTLIYVRHETDVWLEITTLLIPGENDSNEEIERECRWVVEHLGPEVPVHFTAFHPDWKLNDRPPTPGATLRRARHIALDQGIRYPYVGNVHDSEGDSTYCHACGATLIGRNWYELLSWSLTDDGLCRDCGERCAGVFEGPPGDWGAKRQPVSLGPSPRP